MSRKPNIPTSESLENLINQMRGLGNRTVLYQQVASSNLKLYNNDYISIDILREKGPITAGELSQLTGLTTGSVTALIDRLEKHGYVRRENDPNDRRKVIIVPLYEEKEEVSNAYHPLYQAMLVLGSKYTAEELELITNFLVEAGGIIEEQTVHLTAKPREKK